MGFDQRDAISLPTMRRNMMFATQRNNISQVLMTKMLVDSMMSFKARVTTHSTAPSA